MYPFYITNLFKNIKILIMQTLLEKNKNNKKEISELKEHKDSAQKDLIKDQLTASVLNKDKRLQFLDDIIRFARDGIFIINPNIKAQPIVYANPAFYEITGYSPLEVLGKSYDIIRAEISNSWLEAKKFIKKGNSFEGESLNYRKDGSPFWNSLTVSPINDENQKLIYSLCVLKDITKQKMIEDLLKQKNDEMSSFIYKASHDLKGPLASIIGLANIAKEEVKENHALKLINFIADSTKRLDTILNDLIGVTRVTHGEIKLRKVNIEKVVNDIITSLKHADYSKNVDFQITVNMTKQFYTDEKLLISILQNLIDNAIKYKDKRMKPFVRVSVNQCAKGLMMEVKDNGIGISDKIRTKVFDMFYRGSDISKGSGLGLYIVKTSVKKLSGFIDFYSKEREGTSFNVYLPPLRNKV